MNFNLRIKKDNNYIHPFNAPAERPLTTYF